MINKVSPAPLNKPNPDLVKDDFLSVADTGLKKQIAEAMNMTPEKLDAAIKDGTVDRELLNQAFEKVTKEASIPELSNSNPNFQNAVKQDRLDKVGSKLNLTI